MIREARKRVASLLRCSVYSALILAVANVASAGSLPEYDRVRILSQPEVIGGSEVDLRSHLNEPFTISDLHGRPALVFFGFTNCPDVCPATMLRFQAFYSEYPEIADQLSILLVSVDGERDTPEVMREYLDRFGLGFVGITGEPADVLRIAREFRAPFYKGSPANDDRTYSVAHSPAVFALDAEGRLRAELYNSSIEAMAGISSALLEEENETADQ